MEKEQLIEGLLSVASEEIKKQIDDRLENLSASIEASVDGLAVGLRERISTLEAYTTQAPLVINIGSKVNPKVKIVHQAFDDIISILKSTKRKEKNIMLVGGAGSGKTHLVSTVADALGRDFYPMSVGFILEAGIQTEL